MGWLGVGCRDNTQAVCLCVVNVVSLRINEQMGVHNLLWLQENSFFFLDELWIAALELAT